MSISKWYSYSVHSTYWYHAYGHSFVIINIPILRCYFSKSPFDTNSHGLHDIIVVEFPISYAALLMKNENDKNPEKFKSTLKSM